MHAIGRSPAGSADGARHYFGPRFDVTSRVTDDSRVAGRAARGVDADDLIEWNGKHSVRVRLAKVVLRCEWEPRQVVETPAFNRMHAGVVEPSPVEFDVLVRVTQGPPQALELECGEFVA